METIYQTFQRLTNDGHSPEEVATMAVEAFDDADTLRQFVAPLLLNLAKNTVRREVRRREERAFPNVGPKPKRNTPVDAGTVAEARRELVADRFSVGDGTWVRWGEATLEQHATRMRWQTQLADGALASAARHRAAIKMIEDAGVACLDEIPDWKPQLDEVAPV